MTKHRTRERDPDNPVGEERKDIEKRRAEVRKLKRDRVKIEPEPWTAEGYRLHLDESFFESFLLDDAEK